MSTATEEQIQWLMDRAEIHDLIMAYARYVDTSPVFSSGSGAGRRG
jgi:hypothetical protein